MAVIKMLSNLLLTADLNSCLQEASAKKEDVSCSQIQA